MADAIITQKFAHISDEDKEAAVRGFVNINPHQEGIDFFTMMEIILDSDSHLPIIGDVEVKGDDATKLVEYFVHASRRGWYGMWCFNALSTEQQDRLVNWGNLPYGYRPEGECRRGAEVGIERPSDKTPGNRYYCRVCALKLILTDIPQSELIDLLEERQSDVERLIREEFDATELKYEPTHRSISDGSDVMFIQRTGEFQFKAENENGDELTLDIREWEPID